MFIVKYFVLIITPDERTGVNNANIRDRAEELAQFCHYAFQNPICQGSV
jgi:hypothetical protein